MTEIKKLTAHKLAKDLMKYPDLPIRCSFVSKKQLVYITPITHIVLNEENIEIVHAQNEEIAESFNKELQNHHLRNKKH